MSPYIRFNPARASSPRASFPTPLISFSRARFPSQIVLGQTSSHSRLRFHVISCVEFLSSGSSIQLVLRVREILISNLLFYYQLKHPSHALKMAPHIDDSFISHAVETTILRLCQGITHGHIQACEPVKDYLCSVEKEQIISTMISALNAEFATFVKELRSLSSLK